MSISYPLTPPTSTAPRAVKIRTKSLVGVSRSQFSGQREVFEWPGEWLEIDVSLPAMKRESAEQWIAFLISLRGGLGTCLFGDPSAGVPQGVATGSPLVNGNQAAGSKTLATKGWTHSVTGVLKAGDYIQIGTGSASRLYKVLTNANSDGSGNATLDIFPRLRSVVTTNTTITTTNTVGQFALAQNMTEFSIDFAHVYGLDFSLIEAI